MNKHAYLICYDIRCPKRLQKIHKLAIRVAMPLQYSVFYGYLDEQQFNQLIEAFEQVMDKEKDDIRLYPVADNCLANWPLLGCKGNNKFLYID